MYICTIINQLKYTIMTTLNKSEFITMSLSKTKRTQWANYRRYS